MAAQPPPSTTRACITAPRRAAGRARRAALYAILIAAPALLAYNGDPDGNLDLYHEGERLAPLDALDAGGLPFRDIYIPHGLGEDILKPLLARRLFGDSVESLRRLGRNSFIYSGLLPPLGLAATLLAGAALLRRPGPVAALAATLLLCLCEITDRQIFGLLAVAALARYRHFRRTLWLYAAGLATGLAALYSLEVGLYVAAAGSLWVVIDAWLLSTGGGRRAAGARRALRPLAAFAAGLATILIPFLIGCAARGIADDFFRNGHMQLFLRKALYPATYPVPDWRPAESLLDNLRVSGDIGLMFYGIPAFTLAGLLIGLIGRPRLVSWDRSALLLAALVAAAFWATVLGRPDLWHLAFAAGPFLLFAATALALVLRRTRDPSRPDEPRPSAYPDAPLPPAHADAGPPSAHADEPRTSVRAAAHTPTPHGNRNGPSTYARPIRLVLAGALLLPLLSLADAGQGGLLARRLLGHENRFLPENLRTRGRRLVAASIPRLGRIRLRPDQAAYLEALVGYLRAHTRPDETILDLSDQGLIYYLCRRRSPTRFHFVNYCGTPELRRELVNEVLRHDPLPRYVLRYHTDRPTPDALGAFVTRHYTPEIRIGHTLLLVRRE